MTIGSNLNLEFRDSTGMHGAASCLRISSPIGDLLLAAGPNSLLGLYFAGCAHLPSASSDWTLDPDHSVLSQAASQLGEYFAGQRKSFSLPLTLSGTDFQERIWREIALISFGETITYGELARRVGAPQAIRAAGTSTGRNPLSIIIPCHRVVGKNGTMRGFAGGLDKKRFLLELEQRF
jgi:methylated-DNA-[protein]-cysteine S-methyltransferase